MPNYSAILATDADENIAIDATARTLTLPAEFSSSGVKTGQAIVQARTAAVLYTFNGTAPTSGDESTGVKINVGDVYTFEGLSILRNLKFIRATGSDGAIFVQYLKRID